MIRYDITLDPADVDTIAGGATITLTTDRGFTFEVTSEGGWTASTDPGVCRFGLSAGQLDHLRWGRVVSVLPAGLNGLVQIEARALAVTR